MKKAYFVNYRSMASVIAVMTIIGLCIMVTLSWDAGADASDLQAFMIDYVPANALAFASIVMIIDIALMFMLI